MVKKYLSQITVFAAFLFFILIFQLGKAVVANQSDLNKLLEIVQNNDGNITQWHLMARSMIEPDLSITDLEALVSKWESQYPNFSFERKEDHETLRWHGKFYNPNMQTTEHLQLTVDLTSTTLQGFIIYEIKGSHWNIENLQTIQFHHEQMISSIFKEQPLLFSSIQGTFPEQDIAILETAMKLNKQFNAKIIEQLTEENFVTLTAKSPMFKNQIKTNKQEYNVQISLRKNENGKGTTFAIGTPILTVEY